MSAATQARVTLAAVAATLLTGLTLVPLIQGLDWFVATFIVVMLTTAVGTSVRQVTDHPVVVTAAEAAMLTITVTALFARNAAVWGVLPGPAALDTLGGLAGAGLDITRHESPPVDATRGLTLLAAGGVGIVGLLVDLIAVTLRRPAAAGIPLLSIYCVPASVLSGGLPWGYFLLCGAGYLLLVGADAGDRIRGWGRILSGWGGSRRPDLGGPLSGARRIAVACLGIAVVAPAMVPGLGERFLDRGGGSGPGSGGGTTISVVNPILNLRTDLQARSTQTVIRYTTDVPNPQPLRIVTDDQFTGTLWQPSTGTLHRSQQVQSGLPSPPGLGPDVPTTEHRSQISIGNLAQTYLPLPYPSTRVDVEGRWLWDEKTLNVVGDGITTRKLTYTATYLVVNPTPAQLSSAPPPPADVGQLYTTMPRGLPTSIARTARKVAGTGNSYDRAVKLQSWFRHGGGFTYSEQAPGNGRQDSGQQAIVDFLQERRGYCVHFASTMAVMARTLGIPARVAVGFLPGTAVDAHTYEISLREAHAWPELYFEGIGWVRFEPTPATRSGSPPAWTLPQAPAQPDPGSSAGANGAPSTQPSARPRPDQPDPTTGATDSGPGPLQVLRSVPWRAVGIVALVLLALAAPRAATAVARRLRWRRAATPAQQVEAAWEDLRLALQDLGVGWAGWWTPRALQLRLTGERDLAPDRQAAMARLVTDLERARYAPPGSPVRPATHLRDDVRAVVAAVAASVPASARHRAQLFPASGMALLAGLVRRVDAAADQAGRRASAVGAQVRRSIGAGSRQD